MPVYEYRCLECGEEFEKLVRSFSSAPEIECPRCGGHDVQKALSVFSTRGVSTSSGVSTSACAPTG